MPYGDGTGPAGYGAGTGWGMGPCGIGMARRNMMGGGRFWMTGSKKEFLADEEKYLKTRLEEIQKAKKDLKE